MLNSFYCMKFVILIYNIYPVGIQFIFSRCIIYYTPAQLFLSNDVMVDASGGLGPVYLIVEVYWETLSDTEIFLHL